MRRKLKSFHKLFFIVLFAFLFSGIWGDNQVPDLKDRIAPELEKIEALPRRTKPAELNIEVTKIKTEPLEEVFVDRKTKNIYVDFSEKKIKTPKSVKNIEELEKKYSLIVSQSLESSGLVNKKQRTKLKNDSQVIKYEIVEVNGKKILKIPYESEPKKLYVSVREDESGELVKVYKLDIPNFDYLLDQQEYEIRLSVGPNPGDEITFSSEGLKATQYVALINKPIINPLYLKLNLTEGLPSKVKIKIDSKSEELLEISESGNSEFIELESDLGHKMKMKYENGYPKIVLLNEIWSNRDSGKDSQFTITAEQISNDSRILSNNKLKIEYEEEFWQIYFKDNIITERMHFNDNTFNDKVSELEVSKEKTLMLEIFSNEEDGTTFPILALGERTGPNGWEFSMSNNSDMPRADVIEKFYIVGDEDVEIDIKVSLIPNDLMNSKYTVIKKGNSVIGAYSATDTDEQIKADLKLEIVDVKDYLEKIKNKGTYVQLKPRKGKISLVVGHKEYDGTYTAPITSKNIHPYNVREIEYPDVYVAKHPDQNSTTKITVLSDSGEFKIGENATITPGYELSITGLNGNMKSLPYEGTYFSVKGKEQSPLIPIVQGNSDPLSPAELTVSDSSNSSELTLKVDYEDSYPKFTIDKTKGRLMPGSYHFFLYHSERDLSIAPLMDNNNTGILREIYGRIVIPEEFEVKHTMGEIVISLDGSVKESDNRITVKQLLDFKDRFPVLAINSSNKWETSTDTPLNPKDERPMAALKLGTETIEVPVNIKETPSQKPQKFFVYDRGEMTNRNLAVGAYTPISSTSGDAKNNIVQVDFEMLLEKEHLDKIIAYANLPQFEGQDRVIIDYDTAREEHFVYAIRGLQETNSKIFTVNKENILKYSNSKIPFPKIVVQKNSNPISYKNLDITFPESYRLGDEIKFDSTTGITAPEKVEITPSNDNAIMEGIGSKHNITLRLPNGEKKDYITQEDGSIEIVENIEKNGNFIKLHIKYEPGALGKQVLLKISDKKGFESYDLELKHYRLKDGYEYDTKVINVLINMQSEVPISKYGEMDLIISSRYNAIDGQLNSDPILITSNGIKYQSEVLDLKLVSGGYPELPEENSEVYINDTEISKLIDSKITLANGTVVRVNKLSSGEIEIKPILWKYNTEDTLSLIYKTGETITAQYDFKIKCPEFFVAYIGELDFGQIYKDKDVSDITKTTNIELWYNEATIDAVYSIDLESADPDPNTLYLDEDHKLKVINLGLGNEQKDSGDGRKRVLPLTGTIPAQSIQDAKFGIYTKTIQILIHLK